MQHGFLLTSLHGARPAAARTRACRKPQNHAGSVMLHSPVSAAIAHGGRSLLKMMSDIAASAALVRAILMRRMRPKP